MHQARASSSRRGRGRRRRRRAAPCPARPGRSRRAPPRRGSRSRPSPRSVSAPGRDPRLHLRLTNVAETLSARARDLFAPLGPTYDRYARLFSFGQDPRWRRFMVSRLPVGPDDVVLDVATGTAAVALELVRQKGCSVVGAGLPLLGRAISPGWHEVGRFLGDSIRGFDERWPLPRLLAAWRDAGFEDVAARRLSLGGCVVIWGRRA